MDDPRVSRRVVVAGAAAAPLAYGLAACGGDGRGSSEQGGTTTARIAPTPQCEDGDAPTSEQTEGPYFRPDSPERTSLEEDGVRGDRLVVSGRVLGTDCRPVERALIDFWQADGAGEYDLDGFRLRGHQFTDARGRFRLVTVVPGIYPGRTRHIHVKVQRPRGPVLTTQLYFGGEGGNARDGLFDPALVMSGDRSAARFDFVVA